MNQSRQLAELPESRATGKIKEIFEEIKHFSGVPLVALIYRHLATLPGVLEWIWQVQRPLMASGLLQERAFSLASRANLPEMLPIPIVARRATGIGEVEDVIIGRSLAAFNRTNPINVLALRCIRRGMRDGFTGGQEPKLCGSAPPEPLPPVTVGMLSPEAMLPAAREIVELLSHRSRNRYPGIWPSLYRYLAHVPEYLGLVAVVLPPHFEEIELAVSRLNAEIEIAVDELLAYTSAPDVDAPTGNAREALDVAIGNFTMLIPEMLVIGTMLERATAPLAAPSSTTY